MYYESETLAYMLYDHCTEKIICFCDTEAQIDQAAKDYISDCTRRHKPYDLYTFENRQ